MTTKPLRPHEAAQINGIAAAHRAGFADGQNGAPLVPPAWVRLAPLHMVAYRNGYAEGSAVARAMDAGAVVR